MVRHRTFISTVILIGWMNRFLPSLHVHLMSSLTALLLVKSNLCSYMSIKIDRLPRNLFNMLRSVVSRASSSRWTLHSSEDEKRSVWQRKQVFLCKWWPCRTCAWNSMTKVQASRKGMKLIGTREQLVQSVWVPLLYKYNDQMVFNSHG